MKVSNILAGTASIKKLQTVIWQNIKGQYMRKPNIVAASATFKQLKGVILLNIKGQCTKE